MAVTQKTKLPLRTAEREVHTAPIDRDRLQAIYKEHHLDVKFEKESANEVNFERLFQDNLPAEAIDLRDFLKKYKEKDESKEFDIN